MAPVLKDGSGGEVLDLKLPDSLYFIPLRAHDAMAQLDMAVEVVFPGDIAEVFQNLRGARVAKTATAKRSSRERLLGSYKVDQFGFGSQVN